MKKAIVCGEVSFPNGGAQASRLINIGRILKENGYAVSLLGMGNQKNITHSSIDEMEISNIIIDNTYNAIKRNRQRCIDLNEKLLSYDHIDCVIYAASYEDGIYRTIRKYCKSHNTKLIVSVCEWYAFHQYSGLVGKAYVLLNWYANAISNVRVGNVISISTYLHNYYLRKGCSSILIPTIVDVKNMDYQLETNNDKITIVYAGNPGKKDDLASVIKAISSLEDKFVRKLRFDIYGVDEKFLVDQLKIDISMLKRLSDTIVAHGRVPVEQVNKKLMGADYTILIRPQKRYSKAGYPTKVGESMAFAVPVIANLTSDLNRDIIDGLTGLVVQNNREDEVARALRRALCVGKEELHSMRVNCREKAMEVFDYRTYTCSLEELILGIEHP